jgi:hypothetical protein
VYGVECVVLNGEYVCLGVGLCLVVLFEKGESISRGGEVGLLDYLIIEQIE